MVNALTRKIGGDSRSAHAAMTMMENMTERTCRATKWARVVDASGQPVAGARVTLVVHGSGDGPEDAFGVYDFESTSDANAAGEARVCDPSDFEVTTRWGEHELQSRVKGDARFTATSGNMSGEARAGAGWPVTIFVR